jgi:hypothetical protein
VLDFASAGKDSIAAVAEASGSAVYHYDSTTGVYGAAITSDATPTAEYAVIGVDTSLNRVLVAHWTSNASRQLETWSITTNTEIGKPVTLSASQYTLLGGRVDQTRHRAALLVWAQPGNADEVLPLDMTTGSLGTAIPLDTVAGMGAGYYNTMDLDQTTGHVQVAHLTNSRICFGAGTSQVLDVNLDNSTVTASTSVLSRCGLAFADDQQGGSGWLLFQTSFSVNFPGTPALESVNEQTLVGSSGPALRKEQPMTFAVDSVNRVAVVAYYTPLGQVIFGQGMLMTDSNSMSQLDLVDLDTGAVLRTLSTFNFAAGFTGPLASNSERGIQLDPSTRTGWMVGPYGSQIQSFKY